MKKFLIKAVVFAVLIFVIDVTMAYLLSDIAMVLQYDRRLEKIVTHQESSDIIILGSSRAARDIDACMFKQELGRSAFSYGYPGSNVDFHETLLRLLVENNPQPKLLILVVDQTEIIANNSINFRLDKLYPLVGNERVKEILDERENEAFTYTSIFQSAKYKKMFPKGFLRKLYIEKTDTLNECGSMLLSFKSITYDTMNYFDNPPDYNKDEEDAYLKDKFESMLDMCKKNNITVLFIIPPNFSAYSKGFVDRMVEYTGDDILLYRSDSSKYFDKNLFYDRNHLNNNGARIFTQDIIDYIINTPRLRSALGL